MIKISEFSDTLEYVFLDLLDLNSAKPIESTLIIVNLLNNSNKKDREEFIKLIKELNRIYEEGELYGLKRTKKGIR